MVEQGQSVSEFLGFGGNVLAEVEVTVENLLVKEVCANASSLLREWDHSIFLWPDSGLAILLLKEAGIGSFSLNCSKNCSMSDTTAVFMRFPLNGNSVQASHV